MDVPLTAREIRLIETWKEGALWPDEERVLGKLRRAAQAGEAPGLSRLQVQMIYGWVEEQVGGHYGGGQVLNPEEQIIIKKLEGAMTGGHGERSRGLGRSIRHRSAVDAPAALRAL